MKWNTILINSSFHEHEARIIQQIPLRFCGRKDKYARHFSANGMYSTISGYVRAQERQEEESRSRTSDEQMSENVEGSKHWHISGTLTSSRRLNISSGNASIIFCLLMREVLGGQEK